MQQCRRCAPWGGRYHSDYVCAHVVQVVQELPAVKVLQVTVTATVEARPAQAKGTSPAMEAQATAWATMQTGCQEAEPAQARWATASLGAARAAGTRGVAWAAATQHAARAAGRPGVAWAAARQRAARAAGRPDGQWAAPGRTPCSAAESAQQAPEEATMRARDPGHAHAPRESREALQCAPVHP